MEVLGIEVPGGLAGAWRSWIAPAAQPFLVRDADESALHAAQACALTPELRDTFHIWNLGDDVRPVWLTEDAFAALPRATRAGLVRSQAALGRGAVPTVRAWVDVLDPKVLRGQADGHRFVWWPSLLARRADVVLGRIVAEAWHSSRHSEVRASSWTRCAEVLRYARTIAGTFPGGSGPNCFGTVMAASGVPGAADTWMLQAPFASWLAENSRPGGSDEMAGTILVWRDAAGLERHAAVTIGDGWGLEKASQSWATPRAVLRVRDIIRMSRAPGLHLERHTLQLKVR